MIKHFVKSVSIVLICPLLVIFGICGLFANKTSLIMAWSQLLSLIPGKSGSFLRIAFYRFTLKKCHSEAVIYFGTLFSSWDIEIGRGVYIGANCNIGACRLENDVLLGSNVHIMSGKRQHDFTRLDIRIQDQGGVYEAVTVGEDTWIGNGALVMADVGRKCVIAAGTVVTQPIPDYSVAAGNPAEIVKQRR